MEQKRVIIVDDEMVLGHLMQAAFATMSTGIDVLVVASAEEAAAELNDKPTHLLVCDVRLPGMSGLDFTAEIKKQHPKIKTIIVSGLNDPRLREKALSAGADAFFPKPVEMHLFLETSASLLGSLRPQTGKLPVVELVDNQSDLLVDILINLRQELGAVAVALVDDRSKVAASAGELPDDQFHTRIIPYLISLAGSVERLNAALQPEEPENILSIKGRDYNLMVSLLAPGYLLVVVLKHKKGTARLAIAYDAVSETVSEIQSKLHEITAEQPGPFTEDIESIPAFETAAAQITTEKPETADLDKIFGTKAHKAVKPQDVDSFWEDATSKPTASTSKATDVLSFDEAVKLGFSPGDAEKKPPP